MAYKREDPELETALVEGHLPDDEEDFFTEIKMQQFYQKVVEREIEDARKMGGTIAGLSEGGTLQNRNQDPDQDDHAPDF